MKNVLVPVFAIFFSILVCSNVYAEINDGLYTHFEFEGNLNDTVSNLLSFEYGNGLSYEEGVVGDYAGRFDGETAILFPDDYLFPLCNGTINFFIKIDPEIVENVTIMCSKTNYKTCIDYYAESNELGGYAKAPIEKDHWYMFTFVYSNGCSSNGSRKAYIDGVLIDETTGYANNANIGTWYTSACSYYSLMGIGLVSDEYLPTRAKFKGLLDDVRIYNRALPDSEIQELYLLGDIDEEPENVSEFTIQPGSEGKDTSYGTVYHRDGIPDSEYLSYGGWGDYYYDYLEFDLTGTPNANDTISAELYLYSKSQPANNPQFQIRRITEPWAEAEVSIYSNPASEYYKNAPPVVYEWNIFDITELYKDWKDGVFSNYGIKLLPTYNNHSNSAFFSSDYMGDPSLRPKLVITYKASEEPEVNNPPVLGEIENQAVNEGEYLAFSLMATDPDGDNLTFSADNLPAGATFSSGIFEWTPDYDQSGNYEDIEFCVSDDGEPLEIDCQLVTITVGNTNQTPIFGEIPAQKIPEEQLLQFTISAYDPDISDSVLLSSGQLPDGATFNTDTGHFSWIPDGSQVGNHTVSFYATDDGEPAQVGQIDILITVGDVPTPSEITEGIIDVISNNLDLPKTVINSYLANLKKVAIFVKDGKIQAAINQISAFEKKVEEDVQDGLLTSDDGDMLLEMAEILRSSIQTRLDELIFYAKRTQTGQELSGYIDSLEERGLFDIINIPSPQGSFTSGITYYPFSEFLTDSTLACYFEEKGIDLNDKVSNDVILASTLIHEVSHYRDIVIASETLESFTVGDTEIVAHANQYAFLLEAMDNGDLSLDVFNSLDEIVLNAMETCWKFTYELATREEAISALITKGYEAEVLNISVNIVCMVEY